MMNEKALIKALKQFKELQDKADEIKTKLEEAKAGIKMELTLRNTTKLTVGEYKVTLSDCARTDVEDKKLKETYPDIYNMFSKTVTFQRLTVTD